MAKKSITRNFEISLPCIDGTLLKELEFIVKDKYDLAHNWAILATSTAILTQIVFNSKKQLKHQDFASSESVNRIVKRVLSNSFPARVIYGLAAIRRSLGIYSLLDQDMVNYEIANDLVDLVENVTGPASTKGGERAAYTSSERTRKYRRGLMLQSAGTISNRSITRPTAVMSKVNADLATIDLIIQASPFKGSIVKDAVIISLQEILGYNEPVELVDNFVLNTSSNLTSLEEELDFKINRKSLEISEKEIAVDFDSLTEIQRLVFLAKKRLT